MTDTALTTEPPTNATIIETWWSDVTDGTAMPDIHDILDHWGPECWACHTPLNHTTATRDHLLPQMRNGSNDITNVAPACAPCNHRKGNRTPLEWLGDDCPPAFRDVSQNGYRPIPDYAPAGDSAQLIAADFGIELPNDAAMAIAQAVAVTLTLHPPSSSANRLSMMLRSSRNRIHRQGRKVAALKADRDDLAGALLSLANAFDKAASGDTAATDSQLLDLAHEAVLTFRRIKADG